MKLLFIGSGSAFTVDNDNYNSNMLLLDTENSEKLLIDCGSDARRALHKQGYSYEDIDNVYISHLHADHSGGLEWLGFTRKFTENCVRPNLFTDESVAKDLWSNTLSGGMMTLQGIKAELADFFDLHKIPKGGSFVWNGIIFKTIRTVHAFNNDEIVPSYGLFFIINNTRIFITTDTQFTPIELGAFYEDADIIFQDCETSLQPSGVHAHFNQLVKLDPVIKAKMWLYHYSPGQLPDAKAQGFRGFITCGQAFEF